MPVFTGGETRAVEIAGIADGPDGKWMQQMARNLTALVRHLRYLVKEFMAHHMAERFHQGIGGQLIRNVGPANDKGADGKVVCRSRLGEMLNYYYREAA